MDLTLGIVGVLGLIGYNFSQARKKNSAKRTKISPHDQPNGESVYASSDFKKITKQEQEKLDNFYNDSRDFKNTNKFTLLSDRSSDIINGPMFNTGKYYMAQESSKVFNPQENFTNISELSNQETDFSHKNMVPFFKGTPNTVMDSTSSQLLERYTGRGETDIGHKREMENQIKPVAQNIYGSQAFSTLVDSSRFEAQVSNKQSNVLPFTQIMGEIPILDFNNRPGYKTTDELRIASKPKVEYEGRMNQGSREIQRGIEPEFVKNRPYTYYENSPAKYFTNAMPETLAPPVVNFKDTWKDTSKKELAAAQLNLGNAHDYRYGGLVRLAKEEGPNVTLYGGDKRQTYADENNWVRNRGNLISHRNESIQNTYVAPTQERETTNRPELLNAFSKTGTYRSFEDQAKITNKQNTLYEYKGSLNPQNVFIPENRDMYYAAEFKNKPTTSFTPGGVDGCAQGVGVESMNITGTNRVDVQNYFGNTSSVTPMIATANLMGEVTNQRNTSEHDFGNRIGFVRN